MSPEPDPHAKQNGDSLAVILDLKYIPEENHEMDTTQDQPEEDTVAEAGYCVECEGAVLSL